MSGSTSTRISAFKLDAVLASSILVNDGGPGKFKVHGQIDVAPGNGPRYIAIRGMPHFERHSKRPSHGSLLI
jgi:hypothetical protein